LEWGGGQLAELEGRKVPAPGLKGKKKKKKILSQGEEGGVMEGPNGERGRKKELY